MTYRREVNKRRRAEKIDRAAKWRARKIARRLAREERKRNKAAKKKTCKGFR